MDTKIEIPAQYADDPMFLEVMREALDIQNRFAAEPVYSKTGKGFLKSVGVEDLEKLKAWKDPQEKSLRDEC